MTKRRRVTQARIESNRWAARSHGLRAIEDRGAEALPADAPEVRTLTTLAAVTAEVERLEDAALWIAATLGTQWPGDRQGLALSEAGRLLALYSDIAGRALAAGLEIRAGAVRRLPGELHPDDYIEAVKRSSEITTLLFQMVGIGRAWLNEHSVYNTPESEKPGQPRPLLRYYGEYLERSRRQAMRHAALLAMGEADGDDLSLALARSISENTNEKTE